MLITNTMLIQNLSMHKAAKKSTSEAHKRPTTKRHPEAEIVEPVWKPNPTYCKNHR